MTGPEVRLDRDGPVATVSLRRPDPHHSSRSGPWEALREIGRQLPGDVRTVVVRGEHGAFGDELARAVAAGLPFDLARSRPAAADARIAALQQALAWLRRPDLVTVAAVDGPAVAAGCQLALACDLRILTPDTVLDVTGAGADRDRPAAGGGGPAGWYGGTKRLVELVGYARALELCLTGRRVSAAEAERIGLANLVVTAAELPGAVADLTAAVLAADRDVAVEYKAMLVGAPERSYAEQESAERQAQLRRLRDLAGVGE